jgi:RNA polymerase sigma-70 factor (ECF subfamily)
MDTTPLSLLDRLRQPVDPGTREADWNRFVELFTPLLYAWARRLVPDEAEAADLIQDVFLRLVRALPQFQHNRRESFRGWLFTLLRNCWRDRVRRLQRGPAGGDAVLAEQPDPQGDPADQLAEADYREQLTRRTLQILQRDFQPATWQAFWGCLIEGRPAAEVGQGLGLSAEAVYAAVARVRRRLRQELKGFLD